ncbi:MAG TPA: ABC transporter permease subunit [Solirubrobacter sp.]|nr:ABC transporter permease subunit [Solirubrobacter sp.]
MSRLSTFPSRDALRRLPFGLIDVAVLVVVLVGLYAIVRVGRGMAVSFAPTGVTSISTDPEHLPYYAARSLLRMFAALGLSVLFTLSYGYLAARSRRWEKVLIPALDILQSVPVLAFLTVVVTGFIALFPGSSLGLELASIFAIFTSQVWNMTFSFYYSVRSLPRELDEASRMLRLTRWQRYWKIEVPYSTVGLVWNGMMSFGGGWFFLAASEAISVLNKNYALPGIGSYVAAAVDAGDLGKVGLAIVTMVVMVVAVNVLFWRPLTAWAERYKLEESEAAERQRSLVLELLHRSSWPRTAGRARRALAEPLGRAMAVLGRDGTTPLVASSSVARRRGDAAFAVLVGVPIAYGLYRMASYLGTDGAREFAEAMGLGAITFARVIVLIVVSTLVWVPIGVWIGFNPRAARLAQPVVQVLASFPANFLFPFATLAFIHFGISLDVGGILLMSLGAQWYILFNTIAGAMAVPTDLREAAALAGLRGRQLWRRLIIPGILPAYVTGGITASGGAWNASIVSEIVTYGGTTLTATGLGAYIAKASEIGDFHQILPGLAAMSIYVVALNRLFWRRLYRLAETRYAL